MLVSSAPEQLSTSVAYFSVISKIDPILRHAGKYPENQAHVITFETTIALMDVVHTHVVSWRTWTILATTNSNASPVGDALPVMYNYFEVRFLHLVLITIQNGSLLSILKANKAVYRIR